MPAPPPQLTAELTVQTVLDAEKSPREQFAAALEAAAASGLAREAGPEALILAGGEEAVLAALGATLRAALGVGARAVDVRVERPTESRGDPADTTQRREG